MYLFCALLRIYSLYGVKQKLTFNFNLNCHFNLNFPDDYSLNISFSFLNLLFYYATYKGFTFFDFVCMSVLPAFRYFYYVYAWNLWKSEECAYFQKLEL